MIIEIKIIIHKKIFMIFINNIKRCSNFFFYFQKYVIFWGSKNIIILYLSICNIKILYSKNNLFIMNEF